MLPALSIAVPRKRSLMLRGTLSAGTVAAAFEPVWSLKIFRVIWGMEAGAALMPVAKARMVDAMANVNFILIA